MARKLNSLRGSAAVREPTDQPATTDGSAGNEVAAEAPSRGNAATRVQLLDAAGIVLADKGIVDATVDDFVRAAGVARGTFYIYFTDKYDLLKALTAYRTGRIFEQAHLRLDRNTPPFERIRVSIEAILRHWEKNAGVLRAHYQLAVLRPDFKQFALEMRKPFTDRIYREITASIARGHAHPIDARVAAESLATMVSWTCMDWFGLNTPPAEDSEIEGVARTLALIWYRATYASDPPAESPASTTSASADAPPLSG